MVQLYMKEYNDECEYTNLNYSLNDLKNLFYYHLSGTMNYEFKKIEIEKHSYDYRNFYKITIYDMFYKYEIYFKTFKVFYEFLKILIKDQRVQKNYFKIINIKYESFSYKELDKYF